jgi:transposase InsO family protein
MDQNLRKQIYEIEYLRTDGGKEYEGYVMPVLEALGIEHHKTGPDSPQSNGTAERLNRTLDELVRAILYQANLPESFWAEAMSSAAFTLNYLPSSAIDDRTPFEAWYRKPPSSECLRKIHPFESIVHVYKERRQRWTNGKFAVRGSSGCLVGYQASLNGEPTDNYKY